MGEQVHFVAACSFLACLLFAVLQQHVTVALALSSPAAQQDTDAAGPAGSAGSAGSASSASSQLVPSRQSRASANASEVIGSSANGAVMTWYNPSLTIKCGNAAVAGANSILPMYGHSQNSCKELSKYMKANCYNAFWTCVMYNSRDTNGLPDTWYNYGWYCYAAPYGIGVQRGSTSVDLFVATSSTGCTY